MFTESCKDYQDNNASRLTDIMNCSSLTIPDLTPTIGLGWYFFIEMFDHFRAFFVGVFQLHILAYVAPLTIAYKFVISCDSMICDSGRILTDKIFTSRLVTIHYLRSYYSSEL